MNSIRLASLVCLLILSCAIASADDPPVKEADWKAVTIPDAWKNAPEGDLVFVWFRCQAQVPDSWKGRPATLVVEAVDDAREFFFNGRKLGVVGEMPPQYRSGLGETKRLAIPPEAIRPGENNVVSIRVCSNQSRGGFNVAAPVLLGGEQAIRLAGKWETRPGDDLTWAAAKSASISVESFSQLESTVELEGQLKKLQNDDGPLSPAEALAKFKVPDDLHVDLALSEPEVRQPLSMKWDARGRLWVVQYLQYPNPAGLTMVSRDKFLRSVYDKIPPPPPHHFRGEDKITIHEDTDGDGKFDKHKTFLDGLSLCTSFAFGRDGVWVLNPPYLLFYPDKNGDDIPDGDPVVHLEGFGIEDSHSVANNLRWGPDGWLYAAQGSTVTGAILRPGLDKTPVHSLGQLIWRYHPDLRKYEIFAEGGGNAFGVEIDAQGRIFSGHNGGNTRGFHYVQGGYYQKGFGKHGALSNPYTFGYFEAMGSPNVPRFTHCFVIYNGGALPQPYQGRLFGVCPLLSHVVNSELLADRSSYKTKDAGYLLSTPDNWFRPVDIQVGPDGAIYVADMYEQRIDHASHYQGRIHKESGRIYRLSTKTAAGTGAAPIPQFDLSKLSSEELLQFATHPSAWFRQTALLLLTQRREPALAPKIEAQLAAAAGPPALEKLWALYACQAGTLSDEQILKALDHADPQVRLWTVRLVGDTGKASPDVARRLADLAYRDNQQEVRGQLACSARRWPAEIAIPIIKNLCNRGEDAGDIHIPLLLWWAIESKIEQDSAAVLQLFADKDFWRQPLVTGHITERLMRRFAATGARKDLAMAAKLLALAPSPEHAGKLMAGLEAAYEGRQLGNLPAELVAAMVRAGSSSPTLKLRQGDAAAVASALQTIGDEQADAAKRQQLITIFGGIQQPRCVSVLLKIAQESRNDTLRGAALSALQAYNEAAIGPAVVALYPNLADDVRAAAQSLLATRPGWSQQFLAAIDAGQVDKRTVPETTVRRFLLHGAPRIAELCRKHFGELSGPSPQQLREQVDRYTALIATATGNPYQGKKIFAESCGKCHTLFEQGGKIGPDLTPYKRGDLRTMLLHVVNPSAEIREGYENYLLRTADGRALNGFIADQDPQVVTIKSVEGISTTIPRAEIEVMKVVPTSLMPDGILKPFNDQQVRDLFAYLRATQPLP